MIFSAHFSTWEFHVQAFEQYSITSSSSISLKNLPFPSAKIAQGLASKILIAKPTCWFSFKGRHFSSMKDEILGFSALETRPVRYRLRMIEVARTETRWPSLVMKAFLVLWERIFEMGEGGFIILWGKNKILKQNFTKKKIFESRFQPRQNDND